MEKNIRKNAGFTIIASRGISLGREIVLGVNLKTGQCVTWQYDDKSGYNYGHYFNDEEDSSKAIMDFWSRGEERAEKALENAKWKRDFISLTQVKLATGQFLELLVHSRLNTFKVSEYVEFGAVYSSMLTKSFIGAVDCFMTRIKTAEKEAGRNAKTKKH